MAKAKKAKTEKAKTNPRRKSTPKKKAKPEDKKKFLKKDAKGRAVVKFVGHDGSPEDCTHVEGIIKDLVSGRLYGFRMTLEEYDKDTFDLGDVVLYKVSGGEAFVKKE